MNLPGLSTWCFESIPREFCRSSLFQVSSVPESMSFSFSEYSSVSILASTTGEFCCLFSAVNIDKKLKIR